MWEKHSFLLFFTSLCLSQRVATQNLHDAESYISAANLAPPTTTTPVPTPPTALDEVIIPETEVADANMRLQDFLAVASIGKRAAQTAALPSDPAAASLFSAQQSAAFAALSSAEAEFSSVAAVLQTFTPVPQSIYPSGNTFITISLPSATPPSTSQQPSTSQRPSTSSQPSSTTASRSSSTSQSTSSKSRTTQSRSSSTSSTTSKSSTSSRTSSKSSSSPSSSSKSSSSSSRSSVSSTSTTSSTSSTSPSPTPSSSESTTGMNSTSPDPPTSSSNSLSGGQIAGISVGSIGAAAIAIAAITYFLRRRHQRMAAARAANQVYPEEAYLYDPPITPPPEVAQRGANGLPGAGIFVTREFGTNGGGNGSPESFQTASAERTVAAPGGPSTRSMSLEDDPRRGLIPANQQPTNPFLDTNIPSATFGNGYGNGNGNGASGPPGYSPISQRYPNQTNGSFPSSSGARPVAYGLGVSTAEAGRQAAQARSRTLGPEQDPSVAVSPADARRGERMPLSPEDGNDNMGVAQVRRAWGW